MAQAKITKNPFHTPGIDKLYLCISAQITQLFLLQLAESPKGTFEPCMKRTGLHARAGFVFCRRVWS